MKKFSEKNEIRPQMSEGVPEGFGSKRVRATKNRGRKSATQGVVDMGETTVENDEGSANELGPEETTMFRAVLVVPEPARHYPLARSTSRCRHDSGVSHLSRSDHKARWNGVALEAARRSKADVEELASWWSAPRWRGRSLPRSLRWCVWRGRELCRSVVRERDARLCTDFRTCAKTGFDPPFWFNLSPLILRLFA